MLPCAIEALRATRQQEKNTSSSSSSEQVLPHETSTSSQQLPGTADSGGDDLNIDELEAYFRDLLFIPKNIKPSVEITMYA